SPTYSVCRDHGYLTGEQTKCPICGKATEVYSRITGYYRPVQNWNEGKAQEYKDRLVYNIGHSRLTHTGPNPAPVDEPAAPAQTAAPAETAPAETEACGDIILFKTPTCPNCKAAMALLDKAGIVYSAVNANEEKELVEKFGIKQAPTLVIINGDTFEKYRGVSDIKGWLMKR
ncbi:MAG: ribonucleoside triphosphate reductase, partial [Clostridia bacterium]|nr:ribonucleoside triphosphate reductase [Clostridia bacterium]